MRRVMRTNLRRLLLTSTVASACTTMRTEPRPVPEPLPSGAQREVRLTLRSGGVVYLYDARLEGDSIVGFDRPKQRADAARVAVAAQDVRLLAVRKGDAFKTVLAITVGMAAASTFILLAACLSYASSV